ncbi:cyclic nucleotide-binding domain-containing protein [Weeksellaceae bacterium KMM 9713]|uniref:Cyclic nucleotide-binding domain-containing protein n=1 Tax=Profundicola chukchiensis TaxID=2961959 RepID=A0A9X4RVB5_9FLAO|nr:cyclic nucleotide-binding domain-containing protein [Profundicola chukchiensis]MDG4945585.1 cyclic nucleotide-binding domain-containing protein [Profundicola chukchiensis]
MNKDLLIKYGAVVEKLEKDDFIFEAGENPTSFLYLLKGTDRIYTLSEGGKEFTHKIFNEGESLGTSPLFIDKPYPSTAVAKTDVEILKLNKESFYQLLEDYPQFLKAIVKGLSEIIYFKSIMSSEISLHHLQLRILTLFDQLKTKETREEIRLTRQ